MNEVFGPGEHEDAVAHYHERGYTVLRGTLPHKGFVKFGVLVHGDSKWRTARRCQGTEV